MSVFEASIANWRYGEAVEDDYISVSSSTSWGMFTYVLYTSSCYPFLAVCTLFYAEASRLKFVSEDFISLVKKTEFDFHLLAPAYLELVDEWEIVQNRYDKIGGVVFFGQALMFFGTSFYIVNQLELNPSVIALPEGQQYRAWMPYFWFMPYLLTPYLLFIFAITQCNSVGVQVSHAIKGAMLRERSGCESLKLVTLSEWKVIGIRLLGRRIDMQDLAVTVATSAISFAIILARHS